MASNLSYDSRVRAIGSWLVPTLSRYTPPAGMDDQSLRQEMQLMVDDLNSSMPAHYNQAQVDSFLKRVSKYVRANQGTRVWPTIKVLIAGAAKASSQVKSEPLVTEFDSPLHVIAGRIRDGSSVSDGYLFGLTSVKLLHFTDITEDELTPYRQALIDQFEQSYGEDYAEQRLHELAKKHTKIEEGFDPDAERGGNGEAGAATSKDPPRTKRNLSVGDAIQKIRASRVGAEYTDLDFD
ncbi:MAG: hypothetical protein CXT67_09695 [Methanobacteriota archaeon]|nr:MAG: hypothetical protein CXT67_09695 [Euryarchaeota archaeon]